MRVLLTHRPGGAYGHISEGWLNAFKHTGHDVVRWDGSTSSWESFNPNIYIGCSGHRQPIPKHRKICRVAIHVNPFGGTNTGVNESQDAIDWVKEQKPDLVFGYGLAGRRLVLSGVQCQMLVMLPSFIRETWKGI